MIRGTVISKNYQNGFLSVEVRLSRTDISKDCFVLTQSGGHLQSIEEGSIVVIEELKTGLWVVIGVITTDTDRLPDEISEQDFVMSFDDNTEIEVKHNGSDYDVSIEASGDVTINATGDILIGENGEKVAKQNHTHNYEDTGDSSDGTAGTSTKTTPTPNENGTKTKLE